MRGNSRKHSFSGNDLLATVSVPMGSEVGTVICELRINPHSFPNTSLYSFAQLYSNWHPGRKLKVIVQPSAGTTVSGSYMLGWTMDSQMDLVPGAAALRTIATFERRAMAKIYERKEMMIPLRTVQKLLFCDASKEDSDQGKIYVVLTSALGSLTAESKVSFNVYLEYDIDFENRLATPEVESPFIYPAQGYESYFTDSGDGVTHLSLKAKEGGSLVPFHSSRAGKVYMFMGSSLLYCREGQSSSTADGPIKYAVRIQSRDDGAMYVFDDLNKAQQYASSGDTAHCLPYYAAGPWVDPTGAGFKEVESAPTVFTLYTNRLN